MPNGSGNSGGSVVIDASLNSSAMESAINILVADVDYKMNKLAEKFDQNITKMESAMGRMKKTSKDSTTAQNTQEIQSVSHLGESYDKLTSAMQAAALQASKRWDVSTIQAYRMQMHELESEMKRLFNLQLDAGRDEWRRIGAEIDATRIKIQQLRQEQEQIKSIQPTNRFEQAQLTQQYNQIGEQINNLINKEKQLLVEHSKLWYELGKDSPAAQQLKVVEQEYEKVKQKIRDMGNSMQQENSAQVQKTQELEKQEQILNRQVESSRRVSESVTRSSGTGTYEVGPLRPETPEETQKRLQLEQQEFDAIESAHQATVQRIAAEGQLNQVVSQRPKQTANTFSTYDDLRQAIAHVLNVQTSEVQLANEQTASYKRLSSTLNQLKTAYSNLSASERNSDNGKALAASIHEVQRAMQKIQSQMSRPVSLREALGNPEKTLDDIIYKMQQLSSYRLGINVESKGIPKEIQDVNTELERLEKRKRELLNQNQQVTESNNALTRSFNYMKNRLAFYFTVGASTQFVKELIEIRSQYELLEKSMGILVGSMSEGSRIFSELNAMAIKSPFTTMELGAAAKQLTAYDVAANEVVNTTKRLADMAAAVGVPIERLSYALGQVKAYDYLNARDARMFANAGIPLVRELSQYYTELEGKMVSVGDVYARMKKRMISYNDTMAVVNKMTDEGGKFFNFQEKMAGTLKVQLANLTLAWNNMLNSIGKQNQGVITFPIKALKELFKHWGSISTAIRDVAIAYGVLKAIQFAYTMQTQKATAGTALATVTNHKFVASLVAIRNGFVKLLASPMTWWMVLASVVVSAGMAIWDANEALSEFNKSIRDAAKENVENLTSFLDDYAEIRAKLANGGIDGNTIDKSEANKAWEAIKEQIELTSGASDIFISKLVSIEDINERVATSFNYLDTIKSVSAALENIGNDTIDVQQDYSKWWNVWLAPDSFYENVNDYTEAIDLLELAHKHLGKSIEEIPTQEGRELLQGYIDNVSDSLETLRDNLEDTYKSMMKFAGEKGWMESPDAIDEYFGQIGKKLIQNGLEQGWEPADVLNFQLEWEDLRSKASKQALESRIQQGVASYNTAEDEKTRTAIKAQYDRDKAQLKSWEESNGRGRVLWSEFCKWMNDEHSTEVTNMYNKMTDNGTKAIDYSSSEWTNWVAKMSDKFAKEHKLSQDDVFNYLRNWVNNANKWSIFIKLFISTEGESDYYDTLTKYDKEANDAYNRYKRLHERRLQLEREGKKGSEEYKTALDSETDAQTAYNNAKEKGGKSSAAEADAKKQQTAATKRHTAATRAAAKAESALQKAFKDELQILDKAQKEYKELTKAGMSRQDALEFSTEGYEKSIEGINKVFQKFGIKSFDLSKYAGVSNPREILNLLEQQLKDVAGKAKPQEIKDLEMKIKEIRVEAEKFDMKKITDGLNSELGKIKEEYELAVELDANPELGDMFANAFGIDTSDFPKTVQEAVDRMQDATNKAIAEYTFGEGIDIDVDDLMHPFDILNDDIDEWSKSMGLSMSNEFKDSLKKMQHDSRDLVEKDRKQTMQEWQKLLEKYAEYETKRSEIQKRAERERETARKKRASKEILDAINLKEQRDLAKLDFDEFQKSATWITATGDISNLTNKALQMLIDKLWEYKKAAKNLDPKEIIRLNNAMRKLRKEQKKDNPFAAWSIMLDEAKERMEQYEPDIDELTRKIQNLLKKQVEQHGFLSDEDNQTLSEYLKNLEKLRKEQNEVGKLTLGDKLGAIQKYSSAIKEIADSVISIADGFGSDKISKAAQGLKDALGIIDKAESGYKLGGQYGAIAGALLGVTEMLVKWFDGNEDINDQIEYSQRQVKKLENQYKELQHAMEQAYGAAKYGAQQAMIYNKKLQLEQLEEQLRLEKSRKSKHKDEDAIISLEGQIIDLKNEIHDAINSIVTDMLGISSVGDAAENVVKSMIESFKSGEDYMKVFEDSFEDMIDNMIAKTIVSRLIGDFIQGIFDQIKAKKVENATGIADSLSYAQSVLQGLYDFADEFGMDDSLQQNINEWEANVKRLQDAYNSAITPTPEDIAQLQETVAAGKASIKEGFDAWMAAFGIQFGQNAGESQLSALQQGIQGITEDTAGALEAYMNGVSQQVYLHSDLLTQIRDILINFGGDVTIATNAQILLQLQQSFQVQMTIQTILQGWSNASGLAMRVELVS